MSASELPIAEEDLHAFVDGQLAPPRRAEVQRYLDANPQEARRVAAWSAQREALREALAPYAAAPLPPELNLARLIEARLIEARLRPRRTIWLTAASVLLALVVGGAAGWMVHRPTGPTRAALAMSLLEQLGMASHVVYAADKRHPIEVPATERDHLAQWLSNRLSRTVAPPALEALGYRLIGGRLLATEHGGAAALFMYEDAHGQRLSLVLRPMARDLHAPRADMREGAVNGCAWIADGMGYAVVAALPDEALDSVADQVQQDFRPAG
jgi:anti-sigma factor RsiW